MKNSTFTKNTLIIVLVTLVIGVILGVFYNTLTNSKQKQENTLFYSVLVKSKPTLPLKEYADIMLKSDGKKEDIIKAYSKIERASYNMNVFHVTYDFVSEQEFNNFSSDFYKTVDFERFKAIIKQVCSSESISEKDLSFLKEQAKKFSNIPENNNSPASLEEYFQIVKDEFYSIKK